MKLFFALLPDAITRERLAGVAAHLSITEGLAPVMSENLHITLAFLREIPDHDLPMIRVMGDALRPRRCPIVLDSLEYWPSSRAIVFAARQNPCQFAVQIDLLQTVIATQIRSKNRDERWRAHATLARKVAQPTVLAAMSPIVWVSQSFSLMRSNIGGDESVYTVVHSWSLLDET